LIESSQSKYAVVAVNSLLNEAVKRGYKKIGLVGCPCHVEAIRKMEYQGLVPRITEKITILIGLMCGLQFHFEGTRHALSELCGVQDLQSIARLQYKCKDDNGLPHFVVDLNNGERRSATVDEAIKGRAECFTRDRCTMCIDYSSELADISVGDYWPDRGIYTAILARTSKGVNWLNGAKDANYVQMEEKPSTDYLLDCPAFETKKHGAVFRLALRQRYGWPVPNFHCRLSHEPFRPDDK
jgi:coenzyme F420 hydrogenase subunit beta